MIESANPVPMRRYAMFISYRHADNVEMGRKWANWLHETVENYEVPTDLIGKTNLRGQPVPPTLYPVFRDEEELPADADLTTNIQRALQNSELLVVLCSPRAAKSRFVADEIRYFKELGKGSRILALIIDGEPNASDDPQKIDEFGEDAECFPEPLRFGVKDQEGNLDWSRRTEPIAADCRPGGRPIQGWTTVAAYEEWLNSQGTNKGEKTSLLREYATRLELAKLKVIAGALSMPLGDLTQRDKAYQLAKAKRRARILTALSIVFALLTGAIGILGWLANEQRKKADDAKVVAEQERQQAVLTLANSDFSEGANRLRDPNTAGAGIAYLGRSAAAGKESAQQRLWISAQQQPFWIPSEGSEISDNPRHLVSKAIPQHFQTVKIGEESYAPTWYFESADGQRCVTVVSKAIPGEGGPITFRFWTREGEAIGDWHQLDYTGDYYLQEITGVALSHEGHYAAVIAQPSRVPQYIQVWDVDTGKATDDKISARGWMQDTQSGAFTDVWFTPYKKGESQPLLVTMSDQGSAEVHRVIDNPSGPSLFPLAKNTHSRGVLQAVVDEKAQIFVSAASDQSIQVSSIVEHRPLAWPIRTEATVKALQVSEEGRITARLADGNLVAWELHKPLQIAIPEGMELADREDKGMQKQFEESAPKDEPRIEQKRGNLSLQIREQRIVELVDVSRSESDPLWRHQFTSPIVHARLHGDDRVIIQTQDYVTEIWNHQDDVSVFPAIDESSLFTEDQRSDTILLSSLSPDGRLLLTRSFLWSPPNSGMSIFTVWDVASGKPLSDPIRIEDDIAQEEPTPNHAEFSADSQFLLLGRDKGSAKPIQAVQLTPPEKIRAILPKLAEAMSGLHLTEEGNLIPSAVDAQKTWESMQ